MLSQKYWSGLIFMFIITSQISSMKIEYTPNIEQDKKIIYNTSFDKIPLRELYRDLGFTEEQAEVLADLFFEVNDLSEKTKSWVITPLQLSTDKTRDNSETHYEKTHYTTLHYKLQKNHKEFNDKTGLKTIDKKVAIDIYDYKTKIYRDLFIEFFGISETMSIYQAHSFFIAKNVDWVDLAKELNDYLDESNFDISLEKVNLNTQIVGFTIRYFDDDNENLKDIRETSKYEQGVLYYKILLYGNQPIYLFERQDLNKFIYENWISISVITVISIIVLIAILYLKLKNKK